MESLEKRQVIADISRKYPNITLSKIQELLAKHGCDRNAICDEIELLHGIGLMAPRSMARPNNNSAAQSRPISYPAALGVRGPLLENALLPPPVPPRTISPNFSSTQLSNFASYTPPGMMTSTPLPAPSPNHHPHHPMGLPVSTSYNLPQHLPLTINARASPTPEEMYNYLYHNQRPTPIIRSPESQAHVNNQRKHIDALNDKIMRLHSDHNENLRLIELTQELEQQRNTDPDYPKVEDVTQKEQLVNRLKQRTEREGQSANLNLRHSQSCPMDFIPQPDAAGATAPRGAPPPTRTDSRSNEEDAQRLGLHLTVPLPPESLSAQNSNLAGMPINGGDNSSTNLPVGPSALETRWPPLVPSPVGNHLTQTKQSNFSLPGNSMETVTSNHAGGAGVGSVRPNMPVYSQPWSRLPMSPNPHPTTSPLTPYSQLYNGGGGFRMNPTFTGSPMHNMRYPYPYIASQYSSPNGVRADGSRLTTPSSFAALPTQINSGLSRSRICPRCNFINAMDVMQCLKCQYAFMPVPSRPSPS